MTPPSTQKLPSSQAQAMAQKYRALSQARGLSEIGNSIRQAILALAILSIRDNQQDLFFAEFLESVGYFAMSFIAPFFIDRLRKMRALISADVFALINSGILIVGVMSSSLTLLWIGSFFMTFIASFYSSSLYVVTAQYSGAEKHEVRIGLSYLQRNILIGALIGLVGSSFTLPHLPLEAFLIFDAVTFLLSSFWIFWIARNELRNEKRREFKYDSYAEFFLGLLYEWYEGFRSALAHRSLRRLLIGNCLTCFGYGILESSMVSTQKLVLGFSDSLVTATRALNRVTAILGSIFVVRFSKLATAWNTRRFLFLGTGISVVGTGFMSWALTPVFIAANSIHNFGWSFINPTVGAELALESSPEVLGRVQAFRSLLVNLSILLGNVTVLLLSHVIPIQWFFGLSSVFFAAAIFVWRKE